MLCCVMLRVFISTMRVTLRTAELQQVRPIAAVCLVVISEARFTRGRVRHPVRAFDVVFAALGALRVDTKLV